MSDEINIGNIGIIVPTKWLIKVEKTGDGKYRLQMVMVYERGSMSEEDWRKAAENTEKALREQCEHCRYKFEKDKAMIYRDRVDTLASIADEIIDHFIVLAGEKR